MRAVHHPGHSVDREERNGASRKEVIYSTLLNAEWEVGHKRQSQDSMIVEKAFLTKHLTLLADSQFISLAFPPGNNFYSVFPLQLVNYTGV